MYSQPNVGATLVTQNFQVNTGYPKHAQTLLLTGVTATDKRPKLYVSGEVHSLNPVFAEAFFFNHQVVYHHVSDLPPCDSTYAWNIVRFKGDFNSGGTAIQDMTVTCMGNATSGVYSWVAFRGMRPGTASGNQVFADENPLLEEIQALKRQVADLKAVVCQNGTDNPVCR